VQEGVEQQVSEMSLEDKKEEEETNSRVNPDEEEEVRPSRVK
jgi:hypothetical protein